MNAIRIQNLTHTFNDTTVLTDISLDVPSGRVCALLGFAGSGKTTLLRLLNGDIAPTAGHISIFGADPYHEPDSAAHQIGVVWNDIDFPGDLTAHDYLQHAAQQHGLFAWERNQQIAYLLDLFDLSVYAHDPLSTWNGGMLRRLSIAAALVHQPRVLLLDEPTAGMEPVAAAQIRYVLMQLAESQALTVVLTTTDPSEAELVGDLIAVLDAGLITSVYGIQAGSPVAHNPILTLYGDNFDSGVISTLSSHPYATHVSLSFDRVLVELVGDVDPTSLVLDAQAAGAHVESATVSDRETVETLELVS